jgi:hypothetical protein
VCAKYVAGKSEITAIMETTRVSHSLSRQICLAHLLAISDTVMAGRMSCIGHRGNIKGKAIPLQALTGPEGSRRLRLPDFKPIGT